MKFKDMDFNLKGYFITLVISIVLSIVDIIYLLFIINDNDPYKLLFMVLLFVFISIPYVFKWSIQLFNYIKYKSRKKDGGGSLKKK